MIQKTTERMRRAEAGAGDVDVYRQFSDDSNGTWRPTCYHEKSSSIRMLCLGTYKLEA